MSNPSLLRTLALLEPWRQGRGMPRNALDPTWTPGPLDVPCDGEIAWEGSSPWWVCTKCGYVGSACYTTHRPIQDPATFFLDSLRFHIRKRKEGPLPAPPQLAARYLLQQMLYVAGVALRYAATRPSSALGEYAEQLVIR